MDARPVQSIATAGFQQLLADRETRASRIHGIIARTGLPLVELTLNIPGPEKLNPRLYLLHRYLETRVRQLLHLHAILVVAEDRGYPKVGPCTLLSLRPSSPSEWFAPAAFCQEVKRLMVTLEVDEPLGRLFDIDVFTPDGIKLQRTSGLRQCLLCDAPAVVCARSGTHAIEELTTRIEGLMLNSAGLQRFMQLPIATVGGDSQQEPVLFQRVAITAQRALMAEVSLTPKPGLVDQDNCGAHKDMDFFTFSATTCALGDMCVSMVKAGYDADGTCRADLPRLLSQLRHIGLEGEKAMLTASQGVNTQKGLIFSIGLLLGALGLHLRDRGISPDILPSDPLCAVGDLHAIRDYVRGMCQGMVARELTGKQVEPKTYGERLHALAGVRGARGEAEAGFPTAFHAYELLSAFINRHGTPYHQDFKKSALQTLMMVMVELEDTNILGRHGWTTLLTMRNLVQQYLKGGGVGNDPQLAGLRELDAEFINRNLSPGGAADTLATAIFLYYLTLPISA
ncbi:MAG: citrate lyase holo-[acyl-carrier protein] synthase [Spirochaetae bacterium HGW-Spirochaetae-8]|nr:MAG: citrate lyase holo-[acyl-carrier protein] synthase [Spirochaetae bacterium HGW-Spirochaetae-8]